jgi:DNA modification methylase
MERRISRRGNGHAISRDLTPHLVPVADCKPLGRETRKHSLQQVRKIAANIERFRFVSPVLLDAEGRVVAGWAVVLAARHLGLAEIPAVRITDLSEASLRMLRLSLNRISEDSSWNPEMLRQEFSDIQVLDPHIELESSGFESGEIDVFIDGIGIDEEDEVPPVETQTAPVTKLGDLWLLSQKHRLLCGNALLPESYARLMQRDKAGMVFTDPPYNVPIKGHVSGLGAVKHANFAMACGELSSAENQSYLKTSLGLAADWSVDGSIAFVCMDWSHLHDLWCVGQDVYSELKNLCVWNKSNAGMGSLYRSKHEFIFVFKKGKAPHINNIALGRHGRNRTNVWDYVSQNTLSGTSKSKLSLHPTVKPVAMIADAIRDCSNRGSLILDPFGGAGTTLIAAERTGRRACLIELDPVYVDVTIERWQRLTGETAVHAESGQPFTRTKQS